MLLHQIRTNYRDLSPVERVESLQAYRAKRLAELETPIIAKPKAAKAAKSANGKSTTPKLSAAEKALLKKLGVSLKALKTAE